MMTLSMCLTYCSGCWGSEVVIKREGGRKGREKDWIVRSMSS